MSRQAEEDDNSMMAVAAVLRAAGGRERYSSRTSARVKAAQPLFLPFCRCRVVVQSRWRAASAYSTAGGCGLGVEEVPTGHSGLQVRRVEDGGGQPGGRRPPLRLHWMG